MRFKKVFKFLLHLFAGTVNDLRYIPVEGIAISAECCAHDLVVGKYIGFGWDSIAFRWCNTARRRRRWFLSSTVLSSGRWSPCKGIRVQNRVDQSRHCSVMCKDSSQ